MAAAAVVGSALFQDFFGLRLAVTLLIVSFIRKLNL